ncbi:MULTISPECIES: ABC-three component system protein [unclassified Azospirillum]|uniref:ABC-three component system protein n=1 Tax=unclassified Azospirillum TaxID=2630922 RepID=UPI0011B22095|nr:MULTISPECIES: ABC-three component system protein [unclassified Azospirillum]
MTSAATNQHSATGSALGYYYQAIYALILLLESERDDVSVSIETLDDVYLESGAEKVLHQLKHSIDRNARISVASDEVWKTIKVWLDQLRQIELLDATLVLASVASFADDSPLNALLADGSGAGKGFSRDALTSALRFEAERVTKERNEQRQKGKKDGELSYQKKGPGCEAFAALPPEQQSTLISRVVCQPRSFQIQDACGKVARLLPNIPERASKQAAEELIEWWDRQVVLSLTRERARAIGKLEVQEKTLNIIRGIASGKLAVSFFSKMPPPTHTTDNIIQRQIELVGGDQELIDEACCQEWRARNQRDQWIGNDFSISDDLVTFDIKLQEEWRMRWNRMRKSSSSGTDSEKAAAGMRILDWALIDAPNEVPPFERKCTEPSLVRGSYQMLAKDLSVGWHCHYRVKIK